MLCDCLAWPEHRISLKCSKIYGVSVGRDLEDITFLDQVICSRVSFLPSLVGLCISTGVSCFWLLAGIRTGQHLKSQTGTGLLSQPPLIRNRSDSLCPQSTSVSPQQLDMSEGALEGVGVWAPLLCSSTQCSPQRGVGVMAGYKGTSRKEGVDEKT